MYDPKLRDLPAQIARVGTYDYYSAPVHNSPDVGRAHLRLPGHAAERLPQ